MAIIYSYPTSTNLTGKDILVLTDPETTGNPTKSVTLASIASYVTGTGTGTGTTNTLTLWTDGPGGSLGDSILTQDVGATALTLNGNFISTGTGNFTGQVTIPTTPVAATDAASKNYVDTEVAGIPAGLVFKGNWDANLNSPALASGVGTVGNYYVVSVAGNTNLDGITDWQVGDWAVFVEVGGVDKWDKIDQTFVSGNGAAGQVTFWNTINTVDGDNAFFWDNVNKRLGIGMSSPTQKLSLPDNAKIGLGDSADLEIYHDGSNSYIDETGTGSLYIKSAGAIRLQSDTGENMIYCINDGAVNLYHNNVNKLQTTAAGANVTGTLDTDNLTIAGAQGSAGEVLTSSGTGVSWQAAGGGGASSLIGLSDCLVDGNSVYVAEVPSGLSGNPVDNTVFGIDAGAGLTTGFGNTFIGFEAAKLITDSDNMVIIGRQAANASASNGDRTVAIGYDAYGSSISTDNVAVGYAASQFSGVNYCISMGRSAGIFNSGANSVSLGPETNYSNSASGTVSVGRDAGRSQTSGAHNTNLGYQAGYGISTDGNNTNIGYEAGAAGIGANNTFVGEGAGKGYNTGTSVAGDNVAIGVDAMNQRRGGSGGNTVIGNNAYKNTDGGAENVVIGKDAVPIANNGSNNTVIGRGADLNAGTDNNSTVIGDTASGNGDNTVTLGNGSISGLHCQVQTISALSDKRDKTNIKDSNYGLNIIDFLNPVTFEWNQRDGNRKGLKDLGFIAQDLQEVDDEFLQLVNSKDPEKLQASYGRLIPVLVKAIQELKKELQQLKKS